ncbi:tRNA threonylcarbamoyladenosine biosynthesis protein TsaE [Gemella sp. oral taxon 928]|uniref:tRNA (adenosine(37)-N6)-threonylcarbamoyltransferase complex ATPase subunit type 1 TsaE n=1 Tax=Gemella sp. oral taxon 928 TaxID=1785995 RepID=UPI000768014F|nr:tRNA (adenosine(37)-N6)-threonylcarbamoyltransferase complex ATPase subunit type 1 TsaE [Gemella sp. oral taxon 928]AME09725.1 tRNA threonylcarbamoyladenosine biosynthesis protein TsaE [Gemella sp. oral taxon 928]
MLEITIKNLHDTERLAHIVADSIDNKLLLMLNGDLAAGKTTFTKYLAQNLGVKQVVNSPTFNIMKEYKSNKGNLYHIDAYRLENSSEDLGFEEIFYEDNICIIEWGEFIEEYLPMERLVFNITLHEDERVITIFSDDEYHNRIVERIKEEWLV